MRRFNQLFLVGVALAAMTGCQGQSVSDIAVTPGPVQTASPTATDFRSTTLPDNVEKMSGTALLLDSDKIEALMGHPHPEHNGAYFILVSASEPKLGVLVYSGPEYSREELMAKGNRPLVVSGAVRTFHDVNLAREIKARLSITLCSEGQDLQYIVPSQLDLPGVAKQPKTTFVNPFKNGLDSVSFPRTAPRYNADDWSDLI